MKFDRMQTQVDGIFSYPAFKPKFLGRGSSCNVYLIKQEDQQFLIDCGIGNARYPQTLERRIQQDVLSLDSILSILVTHGHADHINGIAYFQHKYPNLQIWCSKEEIPLMIDKAGLKKQVILNGRNLLGQIYPAPFWLVRFAAVLMDGNYKSYKVNRELQSSEIIGEGSNQIQVISTPGHTAGHVCYYLSNQKALFLGDLFNPQFHDEPLLNNANANFAGLYRSLTLLNTLDIDVIFPSHGNIIMKIEEDPKIHIQQAINHLNTAARNLYGLLQAGKTKFIQLIEAVDSRIWTDFFPRTVAYSICNYFEQMNLCTYSPFAKTFNLSKDTPENLDDILKELDYCEG
jgi:glyoxylase-like metal-dependent hydrolase (beta-lactamase superfamily II)